MSKKYPITVSSWTLGDQCTFEERVKAAKEAGYKDIYRQSLITLTEMQKLMGKATFEKVLGDLIYKPPGKPTLVPNSDKIEAMHISNAKNEFKMED